MAAHLADSNRHQDAISQPRWLPWIRRLLLVAGLLAPILLPAGEVPAAAGSFVMGTDTDEGTLPGKWMRRIYAEAFKRLAIPLEFAVYPLVRVGVLADQGAIDGEILRVRGYAAAHPNLVRVEESVFDVQLALYAANPTLRLQRLEELPATSLLGEYRRGVAVCENTLKQWLPAERLSDVTTTEQGLRKLVAGRTHLYCDFDLQVQTALHSPEVEAPAGTIRKVLDVGKPIPLFPYLHKRHADLAPRLAAMLNRMKAEGLIERYRLDAERELGWVR